MLYLLHLQLYGSLALEDNSKVGEAKLGRCSTSCASSPVPASSQPRSRPTACNGFFWDTIGRFPLLLKWGSLVWLLQVLIYKGPVLVLGYIPILAFLFIPSSFDCLHDSPRCRTYHTLSLSVDTVTEEGPGNTNTHTAREICTYVGLAGNQEQWTNNFYPIYTASSLQFSSFGDC